MINETLSIISNIRLEDFLDDSDFWFTFCNDPYTKYLILPTAIFSIVFLFPLYIIIFQHIQDKGFRTVLTYGENIVYLYGFIWFYVTFTIDTIRLFSGPLPPSFCWFKKLSQNFAAIGIQFGLLVCILIRYLFIIVYKSVAICRDELFGLYLHLLSFIVSFLVAYSFLALPGNMGLNYYICTGEDPEPYSYLGNKFPLTAIFSLLTLVVYSGISLRIAFAKRQMKEELKAAKGIQSVKGIFAKMFPQVSKYAWSTLDLRSIYCCMFLVVGDAILWSKYTNEMNASELQTSGIGQLAILMHLYIFGMIAVWTAVISSYKSDETLRKYFFDTMGYLAPDWMQKYNPYLIEIGEARQIV